VLFLFLSCAMPILRSVRLTPLHSPLWFTTRHCFSFLLSAINSSHSVRIHIKRFLYLHSAWRLYGDRRRQRANKTMAQNKWLGWTACIPALYAKGVCSYLEKKTSQLHSSWFSKSLRANSWPVQYRFLLYSLQFVIVLKRITCRFTKRVMYKFVKQYSLFIYKHMANLPTSSTLENALFL